jgi:urocanate hydratase
MKKIWVVGIGKSFEVGINRTPHKLHTKFEPISTQPTKLVDLEKIDTSSSFWLFEYMPDGFMETHTQKRFESFHMEYTDNPEKVKKNWYQGVIAHYKHIKWLEDGGLVTIDKRTERPMKRIFEEAEKHRMEYPELWI